MTQPRDEFDDFLEGGAGAPGFKFNGVGHGVRGVIVDRFRNQQTAFKQPDVKLWYDDEKTQPRMQVILTLQTSLRNWANVTKIPEDPAGNPKPAEEDDGLRRIYVKGDMQRAFKVAYPAKCKAAGVERRGFKIGDEIGVKISGTKPTDKGNDQWLYEAVVFGLADPAQQAQDDFLKGGDIPAADDPWASTPSTPAAGDPFAGGSSTPPSDEPPF